MGGKGAMTPYVLCDSFGITEFRGFESQVYVQASSRPKPSNPNSNIERRELSETKPHSNETPDPA